MGIFKRTGKKVSRIVAGDMIAGDAKYIVNTAKNLVGADNFKIKKSDQEPKDINSLGYTKDQIEQARKKFKVLFFVCAALFLAMIVYVIVNFIIGRDEIGLMSIAVSLVFLALMFRYSFWQFQIKKGKLGCTFKEWLLYVLLRK